MTPTTTSTNQAAVAYLRTANPQDQDSSLAHQRAACEASAHAMGARIDDTYVDAGYSGRTLDRPAVQRLLGDLRRGRIGVVVIETRARIARNVLDYMKVTAAIPEAAAILIVADETRRQS